MAPRVLRGLMILASVSIFVGIWLCPTASKASPYQVSNIYLPIVIAPIRVSPLQFVTSNDCTADFSEPKLSSAIFAYGIKQLGVSTTVEGGISQPWRLEWSQNGQRIPELDRQDVITQSPQLVTTIIVYGTQGQCGAALPQGVYQVRLFLNNVFYQEANVTIQ